MISALTREFSTVEQVVSRFPDEQTCVRYLEAIRWNGNVISPFDDASKVYLCRANRYRCRNTKKYFNVKTNTIFHNTKIKLEKWFVAIWLLQYKNLSPVELAQQLGLSHKTAWLMQKRILKYLGEQTPSTPSQMPLTDWLSSLK